MSGFSRPDRHRTPAFTRATHIGASKPDLERDSGFSDASSEYLSAVDLTDSEDAGRSGSIGRTVQDVTGAQVAVMGGSYAGLSPMIIMNNFVLKQPSLMAPAEKQLGFPSPVDVMPQSQVVLLQPMVSSGSSSSSSSSSSSFPKPASENTRQSKSYMPILKSYPRIAPHPADAPAKRAGSSRLRLSYQRHRRHRHSHRLYGSPTPQPAPQAAALPVSNFEAGNNQSQALESPDSCLSLLEASVSPPYADDLRTVMDCDGMHADYEDAVLADSNKLKRFSNTYNILNKSGLLGITMRTKQLIKENKRTQGQLQQLQEQTALLLEALSSRDPQLWSKLQLSLQHTDKEPWGAKAQRVLE